MFSFRNTHCDDKQDIRRADESDNDNLIKLVLGVKILFRKIIVTGVVQYVLNDTQCTGENTSGLFQKNRITI
jgi:hypothetical protein